MTVSEYLAQSPEAMPSWLAAYKQGSHPNIGEILRSSRLVFYPGSGIDGEPIADFNRAHAAHCYLYADFSIGQADMLEAIKNKGFRGYRLLDTVTLQESELVARWTPHLAVGELPLVSDPGPLAKPELRYGMLCIFEREKDFDDSHGCRRFAIVFLCADGIAAYDALFGSGTYTPYALVLQDHTFGGNYNRFGSEGLMARIAERSCVYPELILCGLNTNCWDDYELVPEVAEVYGEMCNNERRLWRQF